MGMGQRLQLKFVRNITPSLWGLGLCSWFVCYLFCSHNPTRLTGLLDHTPFKNVIILPSYSLPVNLGTGDSLFTLGSSLFVEIRESQAHTATFLCFPKGYREASFDMLGLVLFSFLWRKPFLPHLQPHFPVFSIYFNLSAMHHKCL